MSLGETLIKPTAMLYRNLVSMDVEESIRANPLDGVVLLCGCDKTTPALVMGACSVNLPTIVVSGGPMLTGKHRGHSISTSDVWRFSEDLRAGRMTQEELAMAEAGMCRSDGHCRCSAPNRSERPIFTSKPLTLLKLQASGGAFSLAGPASSDLNNTLNTSFGTVESLFQHCILYRLWLI